VQQSCFQSCLCCLGQGSGFNHCVFQKGLAICPTKPHALRFGPLAPQHWTLELPPWLQREAPKCRGIAGNANRHRGSVASHAGLI
jgi:hypothetical protein